MFFARTINGYQAYRRLTVSYGCAGQLLVCLLSQYQMIFPAMRAGCMLGGRCSPLPFRLFGVCDDFLCGFSATVKRIQRTN